MLCALLVTLAVPLREYLAQREQIAGLRAQQRAARAAVADLQHRRAQWEDPAFVRAQARERLHFVEPGETAYVLVGSSPAAGAAAAGVPARRPGPAAGAPVAVGGATWYGRLWSSVVAAGTAVPVRPAVAPRR